MDIKEDGQNYMIKQEYLFLGSFNLISKHTILSPEDSIIVVELKFSVELLQIKVTKELSRQILAETFIAEVFIVQEQNVEFEIHVNRPELFFISILVTV